MRINRKFSLKQKIQLSKAHAPLVLTHIGKDNVLILDPQKGEDPGTYLSLGQRLEIGGYLALVKYIAAAQKYVVLEIIDGPGTQSEEPRDQKVKTKG